MHCFSGDGCFERLGEVTVGLVLIFDGENCRAIIANDSETRWRELVKEKEV